MRIVGCGLVLVLVLASSAIPSVAASRVQRISLKGTNLIEGSSGWLEVFIPTDVSVAHQPSGRNPNIHFEGDGRFIALALVREGSRLGESVLFAGRVNGCSSRGCSTRQLTPFQQFTSTYNLPERKEEILLSRGNYKLLFLADSPNASVSLRLDGVSGQLRPALRRDVDFLLESPTPKAGSRPGDPTFAVGSTAEMPRRGLAMAAIWAKSPASAARSTGACLYRGEPPIPEELAYQPLCQDLGASGIDVQCVCPSTNNMASTWVVYDLRPRKWSLGMYQATAGVVEDTGGFVLWVPY